MFSLKCPRTVSTPSTSSILPPSRPPVPPAHPSAKQIGAYDRSLPKGDQLNGKIVTVINRSEIVGRPVSAMLANDGADVYSADIDSIYLMRRGKLLETEETVESACRCVKKGGGAGKMRGVVIMRRRTAKRGAETVKRRGERRRKGGGFFRRSLLC